MPPPGVVHDAALLCIPSIGSLHVLERGRLDP